jgi:hypothetical protein
MSLFEKLYNASKEAIAESKKPFTEKKVKRGFESAIDSLDERRMDVTQEMCEIRSKVANGETCLISTLSLKKIELDDIDIQVNSLKAEKEEFFGKEQ